MDLKDRTDRLAKLMEDRLGIRGGGFGGKVRRAGRRLPRALRGEARYLAAALEMEDNPRLVHQIDWPRAERGAEALERYLRGVDGRGRREGLWLDWFAANAWNLLLVAGLVVLLLAWRGLL